MKKFFFIIILFNFSLSKAQQPHGRSDSLLSKSDGIYSKSKQSHYDTAAIKNYESKPHKFSLGAALGCGIPTEAYGTNKSGSRYGYAIGHAVPGIHFDVNFNYQIFKHWGVLLEGAGNINNFKPEFQGATTSDGIYHFGEYLAGPFYSYTFSSGNIFESSIVAGIITLHGALNNISLYEGSESGWGTEIGAIFKKHLIKEKYITFEFAYTHARVSEFTNNYVTVPVGDGPIGVLIAGIGVEFKF